MIVYKCDRCDSVIEQVYKVSIKYKFSEEKYSYLRNGDLCEKCFDELMEFYSKSEEKAK